MESKIDPYIIYNRGRITASKLKCFRSNPRDFYYKYVAEVPVDGSKKRHFIVGNAFDDLVSYGKDYFLEHYYIDQGLVSDDIRKELLARFTKLEVTEEEVYEERRRLKDLKLPELREEYYERDGKERIRLTPAEGRTILGMYAEIIRKDPEGYNEADYFGKYNTQVVIEAEYNGLNIRGKLDRFIFIDQDENRYTVKRVDRFIKRNGKSKRIKLASKRNIIGYIRDWKTTSLDVAKASDDEVNFYNFDSEVEKRGYDFSLAFYSALVLAKYGVLSKATLDFVQKKHPYPYLDYSIDVKRIHYIIKDEIKICLQTLAQCLETCEAPEDRPLVHVVTGAPLGRGDLMKSDYYQMFPESVAGYL